MTYEEFKKEFDADLAAMSNAELREALERAGFEFEKDTKDPLGARMKENYEDRSRFHLPRRTYTIIRLDGKAFHTYTKNLKKPFDHDLSNDIDSAVIKLMTQIQGAKFAYCQSDEISILVTDFDKENTCAWFNGNIQKMASVSASILTAEFNRIRFLRELGPLETLYVAPDPQSCPEEEVGCVTELNFNRASNSINAYFDSRVFTIPERTEVMNYFIWRNQDCIRNSVSMAAQSVFPNKELHGKSSEDMKQMLQSKFAPWEGFSQEDRNGRIIDKYCYVVQDHNPTDNKTRPIDENRIRSAWRSEPAWKFAQDKDRLLALIP